MKFVEYFRNLDSKKQAMIAGALVITLAGGSMALKPHKQHTNPSTPPVSADELDAKDKMISQLRVENRKLKQQLKVEKTENKSNSSNDVDKLNDIIKDLQKKIEELKKSEWFTFSRINLYFFLEKTKRKVETYST